MNVGAMTKAVRNSASEMITEFGGAFCRPMAVRTSDSTMTMRTKDVVITRMDGASERTVIAAISWTMPDVSPCPVPRSTDTVCGKASGASTKASRSAGASRRRRAIIAWARRAWALQAEWA